MSSRCATDEVLPQHTVSYVSDLCHLWLKPVQTNHSKQWPDSGHLQQTRSKHFLHSFQVIDLNHIFVNEWKILPIGKTSLKKLTHWRLSKLYGTTIVANHSPHVHDFHVDQMIPHWLSMWRPHVALEWRPQLQTQPSWPGWPGWGHWNPKKFWNVLRARRQRRTNRWGCDALRKSETWDQLVPREGFPWFSMAGRL